MTNSFELVTGTFERVHGKKPHGAAFWVINQSKTRTAFERDLIGGMRGFYGTLSQVKRQARAAGLTGFWAVLP